MSRVLLCLGFVAVTLGVVSSWGADGTASAAGVRGGRTILRAVDGSDSSSCRYIRILQKKIRSKKGAPKKGNMPADPAEAPAPAPTTAKPALAAADDGQLRFSRDIAPILVNNCGKCHNPAGATKNGKFDLSTFEKLMAGAAGQPVIVPGNADESELVLRIKGEQAQGKKMPPGNRENLAESAIAKIEEWVKAGATLDKGIDPKTAMAKYAPSPEELTRLAFAKLSPEQRDAATKAAGLERWKKGNVKVVPHVLAGKSVMLFSSLPENRAAATVKQMDTLYPQVRALIPGSGTEVEKVSLFVYNDKNSFVEFVRGNENREVEATDNGSANFGAEHAYVVVVDPYGGKEEPAGAVASPKKTTRSKKAAVEEDTLGVDRSLGSLLADNLAAGIVKHDGKAPAWLTLGVGAYFASVVDPNSSYIRRLRRDAYIQADQGWTSKASDALGGESKIEEIRAVGFGIVSWMTSGEIKPYFKPFLSKMMLGGGKLDEAIEAVFNGSRQDFLTYTGDFVAQRFGGRGR